MNWTRDNRNIFSKKLPIPLFYWSEIKFSNKKKENYGDLLSKYLVEKITSHPVKFVHPKKQPWYKWKKTNYLAIGSILQHATKDSIVWGSGIIDRKQKISQASFKAVRGPLTREYLINMGYACPAVYGDPALLLPLFYNPKFKKKYRFGIVPHYRDFQQVKSCYNTKSLRIIDMLTNDIEITTCEILECEYIITSSLHGIIVAHAYGIPVVWVKFSNRIFGDGIKFLDYFKSVELENFSPLILNDEKRSFEQLEQIIKNYSTLPAKQKISSLQKELLSVCPFIS